jgi:predicted nucleotidyltransferase
MAKRELHRDFKEFLQLLNSNGVEYLVVGGYAVGHYGYPRATGDLDVWIEVNETNAAKAAGVVREFGMPEEQVSVDLFLRKNQVIRMGLPPVRIEIITGVSGLEFAECYPRRQTVVMDEVTVNLISLADLKTNKRAAGRHQDLEDLEHLP